MKKIAVITGLSLLLISGAIFGMLVHAGLFYKPEVKVEETGPFTLVYVEHTGDYSNAWKYQDEVYKKLIAEFNIKTTKGFGIYYDDPAKVEKSELRSELGCILEGEDIKKAQLVEGKFKVKTLNAEKSVVSGHPFTNPFSVILGIMKVYPLLGKKAAEEGLDAGFAMEIYDAPAKATTYIFRGK
ncbi:MAG TPA: AraC family transcriptional regulator [bacterium]|nr:AraC family transcriptional regulator [bacterium]